MTGQKIPIALSHLNESTNTRGKGDSYNAASISVYPNPTDTKSFTVSVADFDPEASYHCSIFSICGQNIGKYMINSDGQTIDLPEHTEGMFIVRLTKNNRPVFVKKFIIK